MDSFVEGFPIRVLSEREIVVHQKHEINSFFSDINQGKTGVFFCHVRTS